MNAGEAWGRIRRNATGLWIVFRGEALTCACGAKFVVQQTQGVQWAGVADAEKQDRLNAWMAEHSAHPGRVSRS